MEHTDLIPSHDLALWLLNLIDRCLDGLGLHRYATVEKVCYIAIVMLMAFAIAWLVKKFVYSILRYCVQKRNSQVGRELLYCHTLSRSCQLIPPLIMLAMMPFAFASPHPVLGWLERVVGVYALAGFGIAAAGWMDFLYYHYNKHDNRRNLPIRGLLNVGKGVTWIVLAICAVSIMLSRSPAFLLTGLGAFAAALMLIFKDSILGFVASIQMNENDMIHVGDWIVVPDTPANGIVLDMSLSAVKVQNFDNTIVTVPPYTLVSTSFQNYRGMTMSGARQIVANFVIDAASVRRLTPGDAQDMAAPFPRLKTFVDNLITKKYNEQNDPGLTPINGTIETNIGLFRSYLSLYLFYNPGISQTQQLLVRILEPDINGLPLQIYCFTNTTDWDRYEGIKSSVIEHITSAVGGFGLNLSTTQSLTVDPGPAVAARPPVPTSLQNENEPATGPE